jgi:hypothetical protein
LSSPIARVARARVLARRAFTIVYRARVASRASDALDASRARPRAVARASDVRSRVARVVAPASSRARRRASSSAVASVAGRGRDAVGTRAPLRDARRRRRARLATRARVPDARRRAHAVVRVRVVRGHAEEAED